MKTADEIRAAINKKSFELYFNGGIIWCEHLDGMGGHDQNGAIVNFMDDYEKAKEWVL